MNLAPRYPDSWYAAALAPPRAYGAPLAHAAIRTVPQDFEVDELLSFEPDGGDAHWLLRIQKRGANTRWVAAELARHAKVHPAEVGYAGLKDRLALTTQWFSVPARSAPADRWNKFQTSELRVLEVRGNSRKLKRGALVGNRFVIRLRDFEVATADLEAKLARIAAGGVPNFFGPQRFGRNGFNLDRLDEWLRTTRAPTQRAAREFALSAARSLIFNSVLAKRVELGSWAQILPGELANLDGSGSFFAVEAIDEALIARLQRFDIHPSGPMWGQGAPASGAEPASIELAAAATLQPVADLLAREGLRQERRALRAAVRDLKLRFDGSVVILEFFLNRGQFATTVLREICEFSSPTPVEEYAE